MTLLILGQLNLTETHIMVYKREYTLVPVPKIKIEGDKTFSTF